MRQPGTEVILVPINKKWWQFWRWRKALKEGKHFTIDKKAGTIIFRVHAKKGYEYITSYNYQPPTDAREEE